MKITVLYDNISLDNGFVNGWGFSCLLDGRVLFDTGDNSDSLQKNIQRANVAMDKIETVVLSHEHWDHVDGLAGVLEKRPGLNVCICSSFSRSFKNKVVSMGGKPVESESGMEVSSNIFTTGELAGLYKGAYIPEQALYAKTEKGTVVLTGCAHSGIIPVLEKVQADMPGDIRLVLGGFHLKDHNTRAIQIIINKFKRLGVHSVAPCHCTGDQAKGLFMEAYGNRNIQVYTGQVIDTD